MKEKVSVLCRDGVSIHAPPEGRDGAATGALQIVHGFQSTRPRRGAISQTDQVRLSYGVSIHAPPEGRDQTNLPGT